MTYKRWYAIKKKKPKENKYDYNQRPVSQTKQSLVDNSYDVDWLIGWLVFNFMPKPVSQLCSSIMYSTKIYLHNHFKQ